MQYSGKAMSQDFMKFAGFHEICRISCEICWMLKDQKLPGMVRHMFLAHLVMSLCNHALSGVWCCHWHHPCLHCLCTAVLVTALILETSYPANICINTPSICTWNIISMWCIFFKQHPFEQISLFDSPVYMVKLRVFIFASVKHLYWGYSQGMNSTFVNNTLKVMNFLKKFTFFTFWLMWQKCQKY